MSSSSAIAITGMAALSALSDNVDGLMQALHAGERRVVKAPDLAFGGEAKIADFDATRYANVRGMRVYNRPTQAAICAVKLALDQARFDSAGKAGERLGLVMATSFSFMDTVLDYDRSLLTNGLLRTNPAWMPLAILSAPGAAAALAFNAKAFSVTLSEGGASSLDALALGRQLLADGRGDACLVVGAFTPFKELALAAERAGALAPAEAFCVFDRQSGGTALGEAAVALVIERLDSAQARGVTPLGFVRGTASAFALDDDKRESATAYAIERALEVSGLTAHDVALVSSGASGEAAGDIAEARALLSALGSARERAVVTAIKANAGDALEASGLLQSVVALASLTSGKAPPIAGLRVPAVPGLHYARQSETLGPGVALVTSTSREGSCSAVVVGLTP